LRHNIPVGCISLVGPIKLGIVGCNGLIGLIGPIGRIGVVGYIGHNGLVGVISLSLFILAGIVGLIGFGLVSLIGLDDLSITSLFGLSASSAHHLIIFFILIGLSIHRPFKQGAHGVVIKLTSVTEIANAASNYFYTASSLHMHSLMREKMWWWLALARKNMWRWIASFGKSYLGDVLQYTQNNYFLSGFRK
jgi:hypothetical protein